MIFGGREIDHIVYSVTNLEEAISFFEIELGVTAVVGGQHISKGTKNALINLGNKCYLEILAVDESNKDIEGPRWMGVDLITSPQITRWALKSADLKKDSESLQHHHELMGEIEKGTRKTSGGETLSWGMILPLASPEVEIIPFMTDWSTSKVHPTENLPSQCQIEEIKLSHPSSEKLRKCMDSIFLDQVSIANLQDTKISITLSGPRGTIEI